MSVILIVIIAMSAGVVGGLLGAAFFEAYMQRQQANHIGEFEHVEEYDGRRAS